MRIAATLLLAVLLTGCGAPAAAPPSVAIPPAATPSPVVTASPAVEPPPTPTEAPSSSPEDEPGTVRLPVTACSTLTGGDEAPPSPPATIDVTVTASQAERIGVYGDGYDLVMAPIGWPCEAQIGADGSTSIRVWSPTDAQAQVTAETNGGCYGCALILACSLFATASEQYAADFGLCDPQRPPDEHVRAETAELIAFTDPPGTAGTGTVSGGTYGARGLVWYSNEGDSTLASKSTCVLAPADEDLCGPVLDFIRALLPTPPPGLPPAAIADLVPPAP